MTAKTRKASGSSRKHRRATSRVTATRGAPTDFGAACFILRPTTLAAIIVDLDLDLDSEQDSNDNSIRTIAFQQLVALWGVGDAYRLIELTRDNIPQMRTPLFGTETPSEQDARCQAAMRQALQKSCKCCASGR
jgi:hypothetical protein